MAGGFVQEVRWGTLKNRSAGLRVVPVEPRRLEPQFREDPGR